MSASRPVPPDPVTWLFDRERPAHPWTQALAELCVSGADGRWAVGANWRMDHRVSESREADLKASYDSYLKVISGADDWWEALFLYFSGQICRPCYAGAPPPVSALIRTTNQNNLVPIKLPAFELLVHVASFSRLVARVSVGPLAADVSVELQRLCGLSLPSRPNPGGASGGGWLDSGLRELAFALLDRGEDVVRQAAGLLVSAQGDTEPPWWACFAHEVQPLLDAGDAAGLCGALGLGHFRTGEWLLLWRYQLEDAFPVYRPTVVEAKDSPYHFPSPPHFKVGITMPVDDIRGACREVLHRPLRGMAARRGCTGQLLELASFSPPREPVGISALRSTQRRRLREEFSKDSETLAWINRHPSP